MTAGAHSTNLEHAEEMPGTAAGETPVAKEPIVAPSVGRPPAVLQVLPSLVTGGVERTTVDVARALVQAGWVAYVASAGGPMVHEVERAGAKHFKLPVDSKNPLTMYMNIGRLAALIRSLPVDLVHARSRAPAWSARAAAFETRKPFVTTFHGTYGASNAIKRYYNSVMAKGDKVIANSNFIADHVATLYGADKSRIIAIPRGLDLRTLNPGRVSAERLYTLSATWRLPDGVPIVLLPGRLTRWKGQLVFIDAMKRLIDKLGHRNILGLLVGDDQGRSAYRQEVEAAVTRSGLAGIVRVVGHCKDMAAAYMLADVVVSASTDPEAFGRVAVEAQAMGRPVIATDHGGARETVLPGKTGWLVPPGDAEALALALKDAVSLDPARRAELGEVARAHVEATYTVEQMCASTLKVYEELVFG